MESDYIKCESGYHNDETKAVRFCTRCDQLLCGECILEYHLDHGQDAKFKIEDILNNEKFVYEKILIKAIDTERNCRIDSRKITQYIDKLEQGHNNKINEIEEAIENLKCVFENQKKLYETLKLSLDEKLHKSVKSLRYDTILANKNNLEGIMNKWDSKSKMEKIRLFRERKKTEHELNEIVYELVHDPDYLEEFDSILNFYSDSNYKEEFNKIDSLIFVIKEKIKVQYDIIVNYKENKTNDKSTEVLNNIKNISLNKKIIANTNSKFLIDYNSNTKEIRILDPEVNREKLHIIQLNVTHFIDEFEDLNNPSYVNLGTSILLTGGYIHYNFTSQNCFHLQVFKLDGNYKVKIIKLNKMSRPRLNHSMIYLEDINSVLVCGGNDSPSCERYNFVRDTWTNINPMRRVYKLNYTLLYFNQKTVYCIGHDLLQVGRPIYYICEALDIKNSDATWVDINFAKKIRLDFNLFSSQIIQLEPKRFILVGEKVNQHALGENEIFEVLVDNEENWKVSMTTEKLDGLFYKFQNTFIKWGEEYLSFDEDSIFKYISISK